MPSKIAENIPAGYGGTASAGQHVRRFGSVPAAGAGFSSSGLHDGCGDHSSGTHDPVGDMSSALSGSVRYLSVAARLRDLILIDVYVPGSSRRPNAIARLSATAAGMRSPRRAI
ncbi:hypothetical protein GCM10009827_071920 [Dactylosporangium maewongense]|uniref:Uncharacterized protein n=2 Tax=Micromonosporaceae TaxID=28056 RepID=A0ABP4MD48_9ACTN